MTILMRKRFIKRMQKLTNIKSMSLTGIMTTKRNRVKRQSKRRRMLSEMMISLRYKLIKVIRQMLLRSKKMMKTMYSMTLIDSLKLRTHMRINMIKYSKMMMKNSSKKDNLKGTIKKIKKKRKVNQILKIRRNSQQMKE